MSADLIRAAQAEEQRLRREMEATPLFRRLEAIRALLAEYDARHPVSAERVAGDTASQKPGRFPSPRRGSLTNQVIAVAVEYLRQAQRRAQSLELLHAAQTRGIEVTGRNPTAVVASILSHCNLFDNVRGQGYGLREWASGPASSSSDKQSEDDHDRGNGGSHDLDSEAQHDVHSSWATNA